MIPRTLAKRLQDGQVIPFVGAGVSMAVRRTDGTALFPSWRQLLLRGADRLAQEGKPNDAELVRALLSVDDADYLTAAERLRDKLGAVWITFLKEQFDPSRRHVDAASLELARAVWALGSKLMLTTDYDRVLAWACPDPLRDDLAVWDVEAMAELQQLLRDGAAQKPTVWHLHGRIDNAARLVLTPDGYRRLYPLGGDHESQHRAALTALRHLLAARSLLFVGFSLDDACFGVELRGVGDVFEGCAGPHYALVHERDAERLRAQKVPVELLTFEDFGPPLVGLVERLGRLVPKAAPPVEDEPATPTPAGDLRQEVHDDLLRIFAGDPELASCFAAEYETSEAKKLAEALSSAPLADSLGRFFSVYDAWRPRLQSGSGFREVIAVILRLATQWDTFRRWRESHAGGDRRFRLAPFRKSYLVQIAARLIQGNRRLGLEPGERSAPKAPDVVEPGLDPGTDREYAQAELESMLWERAMGAQLERYDPHEHRQELWGNLRALAGQKRGLVVLVDESRPAVRSDVAEQIPAILLFERCQDGEACFLIDEFELGRLLNDILPPTR